MLKKFLLMVCLLVGFLLSCSISFAEQVKKVNNTSSSNKTVKEEKSKNGVSSPQPNTSKPKEFIIGPPGRRVIIDENGIIQAVESPDLVPRRYNGPPIMLL